MYATLISSANREQWNALVLREPAFALMQSWEWGEFKTRLGWKAYRVAAVQNGRITAGAQVLIRPLPLGLASIAYVPRGPVGCWLDGPAAALILKEIHAIARRHRAIFLKIEPPLKTDPDLHARLLQMGFAASPQTNQPRATLILDLTQDLDALLMSMRKKTRQYIRSSMREGVTVRMGMGAVNSGADLDRLYEVMRLTGKREQFDTPSRDYFAWEWQTFAPRGQYALLMAYYQDQLLAVRTVHRFGRHAAEFHGGSTGAFSHLHPNYRLAWEAIQWAKNQGCQTYDLWGIPDELAGLDLEAEEALAQQNRHDGLWGVYQFKRGFTKNLVCYAGAYDYVYNRPLYALVSKTLMSQNRREALAHWIDSLKPVRRAEKESA